MTSREILHVSELLRMMCLCRWNMCRMCLHCVHRSHDELLHDWAVFKCFVSMLACFLFLCVCASNSQLQMSTSCWFHTVWILCTGNSNPIWEVQKKKTFLWLAEIRYHIVYKHLHVSYEQDHIFFKNFSVLILKIYINT